MNSNWYTTGETITFRCGHTKPRMVNKFWRRDRRAPDADYLRPESDCTECWDELRKAVDELTISKFRQFPDSALARAIVDPDSHFTGSKWELTDRGRETLRRCARIVLAERGRDAANGTAEV